MSLVDWLLQLETVRAAQTRAEREAIWRFRYDIYVRELGKTVAGADHVHQWVRDQDEDEPQVTLLYTGSPAAVTGTLRVDSWSPGTMPSHSAQKYGITHASGLLGMHLAEASRLMVRRQLRGKLIMPALARAAFSLGVTRTVRVSFAYCAPGLVRGYRRLGYRPYGSELIETADGMRCPLVLAHDNVEHFRAVGSPLTSLSLERFGPGSDASTVIVDRELGLASALKVDEAEVWRDVQATLLAQPQRPQVFDDLTDAQVRTVTAAGFVIEVGSHSTVTREDLNERELFVILDGEFTVTRQERVVAKLRTGDVIGEIGFFMDSGRRSATITARTPGKLLVLQRRVLDQLKAVDPAVEHQLLLNLARITAARLANLVTGAA